MTHIAPADRHTALFCVIMILALSSSLLFSCLTPTRPVLYHELQPFDWPPGKSRLEGIYTPRLIRITSWTDTPCAFSAVPILHMGRTNDSFLPKLIPALFLRVSTLELVWMKLTETSKGHSSSRCDQRCPTTWTLNQNPWAVGRMVVCMS